MAFDYEPVIFTNAQIVLTTSTEDISNYVQSVAIDTNADEHDDTTMGLTYRSRVPGLKTGSIDVTLKQNFSSTATLNIDKLFWDKYNNNSKFTIAIRPVAAARSSDNPEYSAPVRIFTYRPLGGTVGDLLTNPVRLLFSGNLTRTVTSS